MEGTVEHQLIQVSKFLDLCVVLRVVLKSLSERKVNVFVNGYDSEVRKV